MSTEPVEYRDDTYDAAHLRSRRRQAGLLLLSSIVLLLVAAVVLILAWQSTAGLISGATIGLVAIIMLIVSVFSLRRLDKLDAERKQRS